jgi:hypothetical protein
MSSIIRDVYTYHGISVVGRGVFTYDEDGIATYAGQHKDGYACGLGVVTWNYGHKEYAEHGPYGECTYARYSIHYDGGDIFYGLFERGNEKDRAWVHADGRFTYNGVACARDDPRFLALIAQVAPVEVRPAAPAPHPPSPRHPPPSNRPMHRPALFASAGAGNRRGHRGAPPRRTPSLMAVRHKRTTAAMQRTTTQ